MRVRQLTAAAAALLLTAGLGGCSDGPAPGRTPEPAPARADPTATTGDVRATDRTAVRDGGTLRWAVDGVPATLNVYQQGATADSALVAHALYPSLFRPDEHGRFVPDPDYLASAESTPYGQLPQVVTYRLNPHAVWSDGTPLSAADLAAQRGALSGLDPDYEGGHPAGYDAIDSVVQGADPHEVKVTFRQPYAEWRSLFGPLYPAAETATPGAFNRALTGKGHPSAGPYTLSRYDAEGGRVTVVRNPAWWGDKPKSDRIEFLAAPPEQRLDQLNQEQLDVAPLTAAVDRAVPEPSSASPSDGSAGQPAAAPPAAAPEAAELALRRAESLPGVTVHRAAAASLTQLTVNADRGPLTDPAVRQALGRAVDRRRIAEAALGPLGLPAAPLGSHLFAEDQEGYRDNSAAAGPADAARLLDEAGWKRSGDGVRSKDGKDLALTLLVPAGSATAKRTADALTADLAESGIEVRPVAAAAEDFVKDHLANGDYDLALFSWPVGLSPAGEQRATYAKPRPDPDGTVAVGRNYGRSGSDEIDRLFDLAVAELDQTTRLDLLQEADVQIWRLGHSVPLYQRPELVGVRTGVVGAGAWGFGWPRFQDVGWSR
ncbi:ABC transporter family substrate-binding protein [Kitasatospora sp. SUK 42]|uniref:ABC transporter family substrate-binding protein n=1 Tax=Kitasatospora sp. SUK 42 TaxID=1588882 RepID=UPI001C312D8A|nr:ABC transporter family substrate-binding protein [Kitasatospora sp. SUK 42]MBV2152193.1 ABC transporter family substrate-binding protein [Kitasatospora sp. SUK 42]